jgi:hypothetical protein
MLIKNYTFQQVTSFKHEDNLIADAGDEELKQCLINYNGTNRIIRRVLESK